MGIDTESNWNRKTGSLQSDMKIVFLLNLWRINGLCAIQTGQSGNRPRQKCFFHEGSTTPLIIHEVRCLFVQASLFWYNRIASGIQAVGVFQHIAVRSGIRHASPWQNSMSLVLLSIGKFGQRSPKYILTQPQQHGQPNSHTTSFYRKLESLSTA